MNEVDVEAVDLGHELRKRVQARLDAPEVVLGAPVAGQPPDRLELHALRGIPDRLLLGQARGLDAPAEVVDRLGRNVDLERPNRSRVGCFVGGYRHASLLRQSLLPPKSWRKNRKMFRTSRKMLAAMGTALSWPERRSRLKSRIV